MAVPVIVAAAVWDASVAAGVGLGLVIGAIIGILLLHGPREPRPKMLLGREVEGAKGKRRILVVANETLSAEALHHEIEYRGSGYQTEVLVVCPALNSKVKHWVSDTDEATAEAQERLNQMLAGIVKIGFHAEGKVGDSDPLQAVEDALRDFKADEIIISTHPYSQSNWLERGVVRRVRELVDIPVSSHVVIDVEREKVF